MVQHKQKDWANQHPSKKYNVETHELAWERLPNGFPDKSKPIEISYQLWCKGTREAYQALKNVYRRARH